MLYVTVLPPASCSWFPKSPVLRGRDICYLMLHTPAKFTKNSHHSLPQICLLLQGQTGLEADTCRLSVERWIPRDKKMQGLLTWQAQTRYHKWHSAITPKFPLWRCREHLHSIWETLTRQCWILCWGPAHMESPFCLISFLPFRGIKLPSALFKTTPGFQFSPTAIHSASGDCWRTL